MATRSPAAARYARAFFRLAEERGLLTPAEADVRSLVDLRGKSPEFASFLDNPVIPPARRQSVLRELFQGKLHGDTLRFLLLLAEKRRLADWAGIAEEFLALCREKQGMVEVRVVSAEPLDPEQLRHLLAKLTVRLGKQITATTAVDASLLGGFRVLHGDQVIDASLVSQLDSFKLNVLAAI